MTSTILVVDDSPVERSLIGGLLGRNPEYLVQLVEDGGQALKQLATKRTDLVITDLIMPEMDGLELVRKVRKSYPEIPVILMTAHGNETIAAEALEQGAASYVPKSQQAERLRETVERVLERAAADRLRGRLTRHVLEYRLRLALDNDSRMIRPLVDDIQEMMANVEFADSCERIRVGEAVEEALLNALYHGNLEISEGELAEARAELDGRRLARLVKQRRRHPKYRDRMILVDLRISTTQVRFVIRDQGVGFDVGAVLGDDATSRFEAGRCRGLTLIQSLMDHVEFNRDGNELTMSKRRSKPRRKRSPRHSGDDPA